MIVAIWIIAIVEVIRMIQNIVPIVLNIRDTKNRDNAYAEFIKSLKASDKEWVEKMLKEFEKEQNNEKI